VRIRIALTTAIAVIAGMTTGIFTLSISHQPASAQAAAHRPTHTGGTATPSHTTPAHTALAHTALSAFAIPKPFASTTSTTSPRRRASRRRHRRQHRPLPAGTGDRCHQCRYGRLGVHPGPRVGRPVQQSGGPVRGLWILISTWREFGYSGWPYEAPASVQDRVALELYARYGWAPWSSRFACGSELRQSPLSIAVTWPMSK